MHTNGIRQYMETSLNSIGPERMIVMLYEGVVRRLQSARAAIGKGDVKERAKNLQEAQNIISELSHSLDHEVGGQIAANLSAVYDYMRREMMDAQIKGEVEPIDNVLRVIAPLLQAWRSIKVGAGERARMASQGNGIDDGIENASSNGTDSAARENQSADDKEFCVAV
jgi:flagellar secretion chaperone FliS